MKKFFRSALSLVTLLAASSLMMAMPVMAAPSIGQLVPDGATLIKGSDSLDEGTILSLENADTSSYSVSTVQSAVDNFNDDDTIVSVEEFLQELNYDYDESVSTNYGNNLVVSQLEALMPVIDLVATDGETSTYNINGTITASFKTELAKDMSKDELVIMQVDPDDGTVSFIELSDYDSTTGEVTAEFDTLGGITLLKYTDGKSGAAVLAADAGGSSLDSPNTGDSRNVAIASIVMAIAGVGVAGTVYTKKKS